MKRGAEDWKYHFNQFIIFDKEMCMTTTPCPRRRRTFTPLEKTQDGAHLKFLHYYVMTLPIEQLRARLARLRSGRYNRIGLPAVEEPEFEAIAEAIASFPPCKTVVLLKMAIRDTCGFNV